MLNRGRHENFARGILFMQDICGQCGSSVSKKLLHRSDQTAVLHSECIKGHKLHRTIGTEERSTGDPQPSASYVSVEACDCRYSDCYSGESCDWIARRRVAELSLKSVPDFDCGDIAYVPATGVRRYVETPSSRPATNRSMATPIMRGCSIGKGTSAPVCRWTSPSSSDAIWRCRSAIPED
jgi:hypothetical protein